MSFVDYPANVIDSFTEIILFSDIVPFGSDVGDVTGYERISGLTYQIWGLDLSSILDQSFDDATCIA